MYGLLNKYHERYIGILIFSIILNIYRIYIKMGKNIEYELTVGVIFVSLTMLISYKLNKSKKKSAILIFNLATINIAYASVMTFISENISMGNMFEILSTLPVILIDIIIVYFFINEKTP
ncbi:MAG: hypothetical protein PWP46_2041 [Fusobacteriaceae bacterium]|jgi:hypothetical protein|nr:hypothetical protein [Fusobacteriales bacterium]MDN5305155.1 hypothetical protein [Fusobacteriaceae bacterium]